MRLFQDPILREVNEKELPGVLFPDRPLLRTERYFCRRHVWMPYCLDGIWYILFEKAAKDFRVQVGDRADDEEDLHPGDCHQRVERIPDGQGVQERQDKKDTDPALELFPAIVAARCE